MHRLKFISPNILIISLALIAAVAATTYFYKNNMLLLYGDAESHLNIAKRVTNNITPGLAQLGGIWLPLPHLMMVLFTFYDPLWRTGLAGSIVSGISFIITSLFIYKLTHLLTKSSMASFLASAVFIANPNILYLQSTAMTELPLIMFFIISTYYFIRYLYNPKNIILLVYAAFWGFCATLTRYDGWLLVGAEAILLAAHEVFIRKRYNELTGKLILFSTLAMAGIAAWMLWNTIILGDPLYFTNSQFSAKSQQQGWLAKGELPAYKNITLSLLYYVHTAAANAGMLVTAAGIVGGLLFILIGRSMKSLMIAAILLVPFVFYWITLYMGQSVIFIPSLTPQYFTYKLFNVRYGVMMVPVFAVFIGLFWMYIANAGRRNSFILSSLATIVVSLILLVQIANFLQGNEKAVSLEDGLKGLSSAKTPDAQIWLSKNYDDGLVLMDDYARTISVIKSGLPMQNTIYIGNQRYWEESLTEPGKYATWIVTQKNDSIWKALIEDKNMEGRLYAQFVKTYTSPDILIFKKNTNLSRN